jgi:hypothetical protein
VEGDRSNDVCIPTDLEVALPIDLLLDTISIGVLHHAEGDIRHIQYGCPFWYEDIEASLEWTDMTTEVQSLYVLYLEL